MHTDAERAAVRTAGEGGRARVLVLGPLVFEHAGRTVHVAGTYRRRLLALLASRAGQVVSVDAIVGALWAEDPPPTAAKTIQSHVARLRASLAGVGRVLIETMPGGYRLAAVGVEVDADGFERLANEGHRRLAARDLTGAVDVLTDALAAWRGSPYSDFPDVEFAVHERTRLADLHATAVEDLAEARLESGAATAVTADLERLVADDPGRERAWGLLMRALYAGGRQQEALVAFQRARRVLSDSYGLDPGPELRALERRVLDQDPDLAIAQRSDVPAALRAGRDDLLGRATEQAWLTEAWETARHGRGQLCIMHGPLDSGRTRLAAAVAATAASDHAAILYAWGGDDVTALLGGDLGRPSAAVDAVAERNRRQPVLIVVDDVEWASAQTMEMLGVLAVEVEQLAALLVLIADPAGGGPAVEALSRIDPSGGRTVALEPMLDDEIARLVALDGIDDQGAVAAIVSVAGGRPGAARREAAGWAEQVAGDRLNRAAATSAGALANADEARDSVVEEVARLLRARARRQRLANAAWTGRQPYRGLSAYGPADVDVFVGRERLVAELATRVLDRRLVTVTGASGSGKSSLVRAGLIPLVQSGRLPGEAPWRVNVAVPGDDPARALEALVDLDEPGPQLLVLDQFEEAFASGPIVVDALVGRLIDLALDPALDAHIVLVVRVDQYGNLVEARHLTDLVDEAHLLVGRPSEDELRRIVEDPAVRAGCRVEPALTAAVLADVGDAEGTLPLVSTALTELWEQRDGDVLTAAHYAALGGLAASIERLGARVLESGATTEDAARRALLLLADVTDDGSWVRRRIHHSDIPPVLEPAFDALVDGRLVVRDGDTVEVAHEIVFRAWPRLQTWLEEARRDLVLGHDLRVAARAWADQGQSDDDVYRGARLAAAVEWCERNREATLPQIASFVAAGSTVADHDRLEAEAQLARERRAGHRLRRALVAASLLLVLSLVAAGLALAARQRAGAERDRASAAAGDAANAANAANAAADLAEQRETEARSAREAESSAREEAEAERDRAQIARLVAESERAIDRRLDVALLLAVEARRRADTIETRGALLTALTQGLPATEPAVAVDAPVTSSLRGFIPSGMGRILGVEISADARTVVVNGQSLSGTVMFAAFDIETRAELRRVEFDTGIGQVYVDPAGAFALVSTGSAVTIYSLRTDASLTIVENQPGESEVIEASLSPDGSTVGVIRSDGAVAFYDARTSDRLESATPPQMVVGGRFALDGSFVFGSIHPGTGVLTIHLWDVAAGAEIRRFPLESPDDVYPQTFLSSPDLSRLVGIGFPGPGTVDVWDGVSGKLIGNRAQRPGDVRGRPAFVSDHVVALGRNDGSIVLYDLESERIVRDPLEASGGGIWALAATPDGRTLVSVGDDEGLIRIWGPDDRGLLDQPIAPAQVLRAVSADRSRYALVSPDGTIEVRASDDSSSPIRIAPPRRFEGVTHFVTLSSDGRRLADLTLARSGPLRVFDTTTAETVWTNDGTEAINLAFIGADGSQLFLITKDGTVLSLLDLRTGEIVASVEAVDVGLEFFGEPLRPTNDGEFVDMGTITGVARFDADTLDLVRQIEEPALLQGAMSEEGRAATLIAAGIVGRVYRFDMSNGEVSVGRSRDITSLYGTAVSADGSMIAAPHPFTSSVALFDAETLRPIGRPIKAGALDGYEVMMFTPDGDLLADARFGVNRWEMDPDEWQRIACRTAGRNLTRAEWAEYLGDEPYGATCQEWPPDSE